MWGYIIKPGEILTYLAFWIFEITQAVPKWKNREFTAIHPANFALVPFFKYDWLGLGQSFVSSLLKLVNLVPGELE